MRTDDFNGRRLPDDWYDGYVPENVVIEEGAYVETSYSFTAHRSRVKESVWIRRAASVYQGTMFDLGPEARVSIGEYTLINSARIICDSVVEIGDYSLLSWNVLIMDSYRMALDLPNRRAGLANAAVRRWLEEAPSRPALPVKIGRNVWIGFDVCILPGVTIGDGSVIGARSVVFSDVPAFSVAAGNPAKVLRSLTPHEARPS